MSKSITRILEKVYVVEAETPLPIFNHNPRGDLRIIMTTSGIVILLNEQQVASGTWALQNGGNIVGASPDPTEAQLGAVQNVVMSSKLPNVVRLHYTYAHFDVIQDWSFLDEDITITSTVKNVSDALPLKMLRFRALSFFFGSNITPSKTNGILRSWNGNFLQSAKTSIMYPSQLSPIGVSWAQNGTFGVALHSNSHLIANRLFNADWTSDGIIPATSAVEYYVLDSIPTGATKVFDIKIRITRNLSVTSDGVPAHLLGLYQADFNTVTGGIQYTPDDRTLAKFSEADVAFVRGDNPYGYNDNNGTTLWRRFDHDNSSSDGVRGFASVVGDPLQTANGQGCILWNAQGYDPRGAAYRPDFDVFPPEPASHLSVLTAQFASRNLRIGLLARPGFDVERLTYTTDSVTALNADSAAQMSRLLTRFSNMTSLGFNVFYFDSFGWNLNDYKIMKQIRAQLGASVPVYSEQGSDIFLTLSGRYVQHVGGNLSNIDNAVVTVHRWLVPTGSWACQSTDGTTIDQLGQAKLTPILPDFEVAGDVAAIQAMQAAYQSGHNWK